jgi:DNA-binding NarL/FixJ family response regulator
MAAGVEGFVLKRRAVIDLIPAIHEVIEGRKYISPDMDGVS